MPDEVIGEILSLDGFQDGRAVTPVASRVARVAAIAPDLFFASKIDADAHAPPATTSS